MNFKEHEANETTKNLMVSANGITPTVKYNGPNSFCMAKKDFDSFEYGSTTGYRAFLVWFMDTGNYIQGDLAVWHWADVCRLIQSDDFYKDVHFIIQNNEYAIIIAENHHNNLIEFSRIRLTVLDEELKKEINHEI